MAVVSLKIRTDEGAVAQGFDVQILAVTRPGLPEVVLRWRWDGDRSVAVAAGGRSAPQFVEALFGDARLAIAQVGPDGSAALTVPQRFAAGAQTSLYSPMPPMQYDTGPQAISAAGRGAVPKVGRLKAHARHTRPDRVIWTAKSAVSGQMPGAV